MLEITGVPSYAELILRSLTWRISHFLFLRLPSPIVRVPACSVCHLPPPAAPRQCPFPSCAAPLAANDRKTAKTARASSERRVDDISSKGDRVHARAPVLSPGFRRVKTLDHGGFVFPAYLSSASTRLSRSCSRVKTAGRVTGRGCVLRVRLSEQRGPGMGFTISLEPSPQPRRLLSHKLCPVLLIN